MQAFGLTDVGRERTGNEDAHLCDPAVGLFVVCDGMGGHAAGEVASNHTVKAVADAVRALGPTLGEVAANRRDTTPIANALRGAIERACGELYDLGVRDRSKKGLGTTCTAVVIAGSHAVLAHVGDSRCYLLRKGQLTQMSADHTYVAEAVRAGIIKAEEASKSPFGNVITRAVGPQRTVMVDVVSFDVTKDDTLLLCSDGLHQYFEDDQELARLVDGADLSGIAKQLIGLANERGGSDNITTVLVRADASDSKSRVGTIARVEALRHVDLFADLTMAEIIRLCQAFETIEHPAGEYVVKEGEPADAFYVLVDGTCDVYRGRKKVAALPKGSHFGEMSLLAQRPRTASVKATTKCDLLRTRRTVLFPFLEREPMLAAKVFWKMAHTLSLRLDDLYTITVADTHATPAPETKAPASKTPVSTPGAKAPPRGTKETMRFGTYPEPQVPIPAPSPAPKKR